MSDTPQARRRERVAQRLVDALTELQADPCALLTPSELARRAGISRNTLYANHRSMLEAVRTAARTRQSDRPQPAMSAEPRRRDLEEKMRLLATHNAGFLQRALAAESRAAQLESRNAELVRALDRERRPTPISPGGGG